MPLVKYVGNADPGDGTGAIRLKPHESGAERVITRGGEAVDLSDQEISGFGGRHVFVEVDEGSPSSASTTSAPSTTTTTPATQGASGSTPSSPTPGQGS